MRKTTARDSSPLSGLFGRILSGREKKIPLAVRPLLRDEAGQLGALAAVVALASLAAAISPLVFAGAVERLANGGIGSSFIICAAVYIALLGFNRAMVELRSMRSMRVEQGMVVNISERFFVHIMDLHEEYFHDRNQARLLSVLHTGKHAVKLLVQVSFNILLPGVLEFVFAVAILAGFVDIHIAVLVLLYGVAYIAITTRSLKTLTPLYRRADAATHTNAALLGNALHAVETIRHFGGDAAIVGRYRDNLQDIRSRWHAFHMGRVRYALALALLLVVLYALGMGWLFVRHDGVALPVAEFVLFNMILLQLARPFELMGNAVRDFGQALTMFEPMMEIFEAPTISARHSGSERLEHIDRVEFRNAAFSRRGRTILRDVSFTLEKGSFTVVIGETGAGKSTLLKLLLGTLPADDGDVLVNARPVESYERSSLFAEAALVPQDIALVNDTVLFNITLGRACDETQIGDAIRRAHLEETVRRLPEGLQTVVGERGMKLSGGERQRIAIARALLLRPSLLLLDEASSALDMETEASIMDELRAMLPDVTVIAVSHRSGIVHASDNVIRIGKDGSVATQIRDGVAGDAEETD